MKKALIVLVTVLMTVTLFISCGNDPFFHYVEFDSNGGTAVERQTVKNGEKATKPEDPTKDGAEFLDWYNGDDKFDFDTAITKDYKLTAKWSTDGSGTTPGGGTSSSHTVTFALNGGTGTGCEEQTVEAGGKATEPSTDPKLRNAIFRFWSADGTNEFNFDSVITADTTLTAIWETTFEVGETGPAGGIIFYVADTEQTSTYTASDGTKQEHKWRYLEVATGNAEIGGNLSYIWGESSSLTTGSDIGSGWSNQKALEADTTNTYPAAQACADYGNNTDYDDWFLPSKSELNKVYEKKTEIGSFGVGLPYLSSSSDSSKAWGQDFSNGNQTEVTLGSSSRGLVRPVRSFAEVGSSSGSSSSGSGSSSSGSGSSSSGSGSSSASTGSYTIGSTGPAGGYIFYDCDADNSDENDGAGPDGLKSSVCNWRYLEAAPADVSGYFEWGPDNTVCETEKGIGKGKSNTEKVLALTGDFEAFKACADYGNDTVYDDWFLPSIEELKLMYTNLKVKEKGGTWDTTDYYWSSSETDGWERIAFDFSDGTEDGEKGGENGFRVRPVRSFSTEASSSGSSSGSGSSSASTGSYTIGSTGPAGGYIFYDCDADNSDENDGAGPDGLKSSVCNWRYLEAAPSDLTVTDSGEVMTTFSFGLYDPDGGTNWVEIGTSTDVGKGQENTTAIISKITSNVAASRCSSWTYKDYSDWFLPSLNELVLMYNNLKAKNTGGTWADEEYLSSTEKDMVNAYGVYFANGDQENYNRDRPYRVRPVRAFK